MTSFAKFSESAKKFTPYLPVPRKSKHRALNQNHNVKKLSTPSIRAPPKTTTRQQSTPENYVPQPNHSPIVPRSPVEHCTIIQNTVASELSLELFKADQSDKLLAVGMRDYFCLTGLINPSLLAERCRDIVNEIRGLNGVEHFVVSKRCLLKRFGDSLRWRQVSGLSVVDAAYILDDVREDDTIRKR